MARILIIDDEENIRSSLKTALDRRGHDVVTAESLGRAEEFIKARFDIIFLDVVLPDGNGIEFMKKIILSDPRQLIVMISGQADIEMAVGAIRGGAYDFIEKPLSLDRVLITIDNALTKGRLLDENIRLTFKAYGEFVGDSPFIKEFISDIHKSAPKTSRFLILGENGTGKELVANMIHRLGRFSGGAFVPVNCAALPSELVESELFGHVPGAFTGASKARAGRFVKADGGSIFLDEISEMPAEAQAKMLRVIETGEVTPVGSDKAQNVSCNIIAASNRDPEKMVADGKFRQDLLYRLNVVQFQIPPLRERTGDIKLLSEYFLKRFAEETGGRIKELDKSALELLGHYSFPGNVRELKNIMERLNIYCDADVAGESDLKPYLGEAMSSDLKLKDAVDDFERDFIERAIARNAGNIAETARQLGLERSHLYKKMKKYGINHP